MLTQVVVENRRHILVERGHEVASALHHGDVEPPFAQVFGHLEPDEAAANDGCRLWVLALHKVMDAEGVLNGAQGEEALGIRAGHAGVNGARTGREDKLVVAFSIDAAVVQTRMRTVRARDRSIPLPGAPARRCGSGPRSSRAFAG